MQILHRKSFAAIYWLVALVVTVVGVVVGGRVGNGGAPEIGDSTTGASAGSHLIFAGVGAAVGGLCALALFAGVWIAMWAAQRRHEPMQDDGDYGNLDDLDAMDSDDDDDEDARAL